MINFCGRFLSNPWQTPWVFGCKSQRIYSVTVTTVSTKLSIEELQFECNPWNRKHPTIRLSWQTPITQYSPRDIEYVVYANDQEFQVVSGTATGVTISTLTPLKSYTFRVVARHKRTKEEGLYFQSFETFLGELKMMSSSLLCNYILINRIQHVCTEHVVLEARHLSGSAQHTVDIYS